MTSKVYCIAALAQQLGTILGVKGFAENSGAFGVLCSTLDHMPREERNQHVTLLQRRFSLWLLGAKAFGAINQIDASLTQTAEIHTAVRAVAMQWKGPADGGAPAPLDTWQELWGACEPFAGALLQGLAAVITDRGRLHHEAAMWALRAAASDVLEAQFLLARRAYSRRSLARREPGADYSRVKRDADKAFCYAALAELISISMDLAVA